MKDGVLITHMLQDCAWVASTFFSYNRVKKLTVNAAHPWPLPNLGEVVLSLLNWKVTVDTYSLSRGPWQESGSSYNKLTAYNKNAINMQHT